MIETDHSCNATTVNNHCSKNKTTTEENNFTISPTKTQQLVCIEKVYYLFI